MLGLDYLPDWIRDVSGCRLAVLGADGFIGSRVVRTALAAGADVTGICVKEPWRLQDVDHPGLALVAAPEGRWWDPGYLPELERLLAGAASLALLAYEPPPAGSDAARLRHELSVNAAGAERVGQAAFALGVPVVFASSADVYGPWHEDPVTERTAPHPATPYARGKLEAERLLEESCCGSGCVSLRIATAFGPGEKGRRAIPSFLRAVAGGEQPVVHGDGSDVRDYVYVGDVAGAIWNACLAPATDDGAVVMNVGSGVGRTTLEILEIACLVVGAAPGPRYVQRSRRPSRLVLDASRARRALGFEPRSDFEAAVAEEARWLIGGRKTSLGG